MANVEAVNLKDARKSLSANVEKFSYHKVIFVSSSKVLVAINIWSKGSKETVRAARPVEESESEELDWRESSRVKERPGGRDLYQSRSCKHTSSSICYRA